MKAAWMKFDPSTKLWTVTEFYHHAEERQRQIKVYKSYNRGVLRIAFPSSDCRNWQVGARVSPRIVLGV